MAKKMTLEGKKQIEKGRQFRSANRKINIYIIFALMISAALLIFFFLNWACIYNTDIKGNEVQFSGYNLLFASFSNKYTSSDAIFGDLAIPFYYYAADYIQPLGILTIVLFFLTLANIGVQIFAFVKEKHVLNFVISGLSLLQVILFIIAFSVSLSMKDSQILPIYCQGNTACSIKSYIIVSAIAAFISMIITIFASIKYLNARKLLK